MSVINTPGGISQVVTQPAEYEISQPFRFDSTGGLAAVTDPLQVAIQHLMAIAFTMPGERVMRPNYGVGIQGLVFSDSTLTDFTRAAAVLQQAYSQYEGGFVSAQVSVRQMETGTYVFSVSFIVGQDPNVHEAVFDAAGNLIGSN